MFIKTVLEAAFGSRLNVTLSLISFINSFLFLSIGIFLSPGPFFVEPVLKPDRAL